MQSQTHNRTAGSQPAVRNACEPCHERKIRCIISVDGGSWDSCESRRISCFFVPRARSGRRPLVNHASETDGISPSTNQSSSGSRPSQPQTPNSELQNNHFDWNWTSPIKGLDQRPQSTGLLDLDRPLLNARATTSFGLQPSVAELDFSDVSKVNDQNLHLTDRSTFLTTETPNMTKPIASNPSSDHENKTGTKLGENESATFLQLCTKLQRHVALTGEVASNPAVREPTTSLRTSTISLAHLQEILGDIDRSCDVIFGVYGQGILSNPTAQLMVDLDHASVSLAIALIFKIFQVCDAVLSYNLSKNQGVNDLLLHKRLDFNSMQARIVTSRIEELTQGGFAVSRDIALSASYVGNKFRRSAR